MSENEETKEEKQEVKKTKETKEGKEAKEGAGDAAETVEGEGENPEEGNGEEEEPKEKERKFHMETVVRTEAPKTKLITAIVMLSGSAFTAIYTYLQHYDIGAWLLILFLSLLIFFIVGMLFECLVTHFYTLNKATDDAIAKQEQAIAQREADELAAKLAAEEAERLAAEEAERLAAEAANAEDQENESPDGYDAFGESDDFGGDFYTSDF